ncbi:MAG: protein kinase [Planctomycetota bacterium]
MSQTPPSSEVQLGELADEFIERLRGGERPTIEQYAANHPALAPDIRDLFPTLLSVEEIGWDQAGPSDTEQPPEQLGEYRVLRKIGAGGMGIVYEAEQETLGRHVALKVLPQSAISSPESLRRFQVEARAAAVLHHPNIVPVFGVGEDKGTQYYVMQYIEGQGLDSVLEELRSMGPDGGPEKSLLSPTSDTVTSQSSSGITLTTSSATNAHQHYFRNVAKLGADVAEAIAYNKVFCIETLNLRICF